METIREGSSLTRKQRIEITEVMAYRILAHTEFPTSAEYNAVCQALAKFPTTTDSIGTGYVSNFRVSLNSWSHKYTILGFMESSTPQ